MDIDINVCGRTVPLRVYEPSPATDRHCAALYYHGGGFLCGEMGDLPKLYQRMFAQAGYTLVAIEYPLCPEFTLAGSIAYSLEALSEIVRQGLPQLGCDSYVLFGRSAGAYLALKLAASLRCAAPELLQPAAILDFYGFWNLDATFLHEPSAHYQSMPRVDVQTVERICGEEGALVLGGANAQRYSVYVYARQTGRWGALLGVRTDAAREALSLAPEDVAALPPLFITASTGDQDVPLKQSKTLMRAATDAVMHQVYYLEHDFDRDVSNPAGREAYEAALAFLSDRLGR